MIDVDEEFSFNSVLGINGIKNKIHILLTNTLIHGDFSNFAFWGRTLNQNTNDSDATWRTSGTLNPDAQANLNSDQYKDYVEKTKQLAGEAKATTSSELVGAGVTDWYLQGTSIGDATNGDKNLFPEGKVWSIDTTASAISFVSGRTYKYHGNGTLIFRDSTTNLGRPNLSFPNGVKLEPADDSSRLGIILMDSNNITFAGNNNIEAAILCYTDSANGGTFTYGDNSTFTGSFIARTFSGTSSSVRFYYDYGLDSAWPPGFKYFKMPAAERK